MLADIRVGSIDAVVCWDLDRLHRQPIELEEFMLLINQDRLALATVDKDVDLSTDNGRLYARIKGAVARAEVERKGARQRRAARQRAEAGKAWTPVRWFGLHHARVRWHRDGAVEDEAKLLRQAYTDVLAGSSLMGIARDWNTNGIKTTRGNTWKATVLRDVLLPH